MADNKREFYITRVDEDVDDEDLMEFGEIVYEIHETTPHNSSDQQAFIVVRGPNAARDAERIQAALQSSRQMFIRRVS